MTKVAQKAERAEAEVGRKRGDLIAWWLKDADDPNDLAALRRCFVLHGHAPVFSVGEIEVLERASRDRLKRLIDRFMARGEAGAAASSIAPTAPENC
jgi:hypothetical protein